MSAVKFFKTLFSVVLFVAFVAAGTYVTMHRLDYIGVLERNEQVLYEPEPILVEQEDDSVYPFIVPVNGREVSPAIIDFRFMEQDFRVQAEVDSKVYHGAVIAQRGFLLATDANEQERLAAMADYYSKMTFDPEMNDAIESVLIQLREIRDEHDLDNDQYVELLTRFVQAIPYDTNRGFIDFDTKAMGDPRMPVQVLVDGLGDCDEKVMLLSALLTKEGFGTSMLLFEPESHIALGVVSEGEGFKETGYEFVETTGITYVSEVPLSFIGGLELHSDPIVLHLDPEPAGGRRGEKYFSSNAVDQVSRIIKVRDSAEDAAKEKRDYIESTPMSEEDFEAQSALFENAVFAINSFRATVDNLGRDTREFVDRTSAIVWIDENAWWE